MIEAGGNAVEYFDPTDKESIKNSIEKNWKKDNLINSSIINEVELIIPISSYKSTTLEAPFLFNDKIIKVKSNNESTCP